VTNSEEARILELNLKSNCLLQDNPEAFIHLITTHLCTRLFKIGLNNTKKSDIEHIKNNPLDHAVAHVYLQ